AFADAGGVSPEWAGFAPAQLVLPELSILRRAQRAWLTLAALVRPDEPPEAVHRRLLARLHDFEPSAMPLIDPPPVQAARIAGAAPPEHYEGAVARAVELVG